MPDWKAMFAPAPSLDVPGLETVDLADKEMERRIVRKQDLRILPWICITYLLSTFLQHQEKRREIAIQHPLTREPQTTSTESTSATPAPSTTTSPKTTS